MSLLGKKWIVGESNLKKLLKQNLDDKSVKFHDPMNFSDMKKAVERIEQAINKGERIMIFGDYDVDGITATAILVQVLRELGAKVSYRLPSRQDGYGLNMKWIEEFKKVKANLLITVDCGISTYKEIEEAQNAGIDVILTDHHTIPKRIPPAYAILHPQKDYDFPHLAGAGVAFKLAVALIGDNDWIEKLVDLASLGTIADCVPLVGENRWIAKKGIDRIRKTEWKGLKALLNIAGVDEIHGYNADVIGFRIGPRLNAAGRLETPYFALQMLLNENDSAVTLAEKLEELNGERQAILEKAMEQAEERIEKENLLNKRVLILWDDKWGAGILGLIASRLSEKHHRPTIIMENRGEELVASCRTPETFNIIEALQSLSDHFTSFGGHSGAAGFTAPTENLAQFLEDIEKYAEEKLTTEDLEPVLTIDHEVTLPEITLDLANKLANLEPYGESNPRPRFVVRDVSPIHLQTVGREHRHIKFNIQTEKEPIPVIAFRFGEYFPQVEEAFYSKKNLDIVFEIEKNIWKKREKLQLRVVDLKIRT